MMRNSQEEKCKLRKKKMKMRKKKREEKKENRRRMGGKGIEQGKKIKK